MKESKRRKNGQKRRGAGKNGGGTGKRRTKRADKTDGITAPPEGPERLCAASSARARVRGVSLAPGGAAGCCDFCLLKSGFAENPQKPGETRDNPQKPDVTQKSQKDKDKEKDKDNDK